MSENSSEFLKRTCLICGCHTNQTINIYEPRSGPNIVQLIQAKFKFQPLNEDKYLCFSCNNWLINWHSLQALNSNDAESPSGTFRSHLNSGNVVQDERSSGSKKQVAVCRPMAVVRPRITQDHSLENQSSTTSIDSAHEQTKKPVLKTNYNKRSFRLQLCKRSRLQQKMMQLCACGKVIIVRTSLKSLGSKSSFQPKCRKCREANYMCSVVQAERESATGESHSIFAESKSFSLLQIPQQDQQQQQQRLSLPIPTVNGKVVSMLRRLGTTLTRHSATFTESNTFSHLPMIMSPAKATPKKWLRPLEDDEILVNFDMSVSEVLPSLAYHLTNVNSTVVKKRLTFPNSVTAEVIDLCGEETEEAPELQPQGLQPLNTHFAGTFNLPKSLTITQT